MLWAFAIPSFLASTVEFVEALTIVLAVGVTINWKSSLWGAAAAFAALAVLIAVFGTALVIIVPLGVLRIVIGIILVLFGTQWLVKAVLRQTGLKEIHNEAAIYESEEQELRARGATSAFSGFGFLTAFKSVLLEGLEVVFIVITFGLGDAKGRFDGIVWASAGAFAAFIVVTSVGAAVRGPLTKIPENTLKYIVGIMLVTFGTFWSGEGIGVVWPLEDLFLLVLAAVYILLSVLAVLWLRRRSLKVSKQSTGKELNIILRALWQVFDFFCGDWAVFFGVAVTVAAVVALRLLPHSAFPVSALAYLYIAGIALSLAASLGLRTKKVSA